MSADFLQQSGDKMTVPGFSFDHMSQFARLGVGYLKELST
jgi:hypothetical protein